MFASWTARQLRNASLLLALAGLFTILPLSNHPLSFLSLCALLFGAAMTFRFAIVAARESRLRKGKGVVARWRANGQQVLAGCDAVLIGNQWHDFSWSTQLTQVGWIPGPPHLLEVRGPIPAERRTYELRIPVDEPWQDAEPAIAAWMWHYRLMPRPTTAASPADGIQITIPALDWKQFCQTQPLSPFNLLSAFQSSNSLHLHCLPSAIIVNHQQFSFPLFCNDAPLSFTCDGSSVQLSSRFRAGTLSFPICFRFPVTSAQAQSLSLLWQRS